VLVSPRRRVCDVAKGTHHQIRVSKMRRKCSEPGAAATVSPRIGRTTFVKSRLSRRCNIALTDSCTSVVEFWSSHFDSRASAENYLHRKCIVAAAYPKFAFCFLF
jgi:hypothetical protein